METINKNRSLAFAAALICCLLSSSGIKSYNQDELNRFEKTGECKKCDLSNADLRRILKNLSDDKKAVNLEGSDLTRANLSGICIENANLTNTKLDKANFKNSSCINADFTNSQCIETVFNGANLKNTTWENAVLCFTKIINATHNNNIADTFKDAAAFFCRTSKPHQEKNRLPIAYIFSNEKGENWFKNNKHKIDDLKKLHWIK